MNADLVIKKIEAVDLLSPAAEDQIREIILHDVGQFGTSNIDLDPEMTFVRGRPLDNPTDFHTQVSDISYNPVASAVGRVNLPGFPVFYSSQNRITSLLELKILNDLPDECFYTIGGWKSKTPLTVCLMFDPSSVSDMPNNFLSQLAAQVKPLFTEKHNNPKTEEIKKLFLYTAKKFAERVFPGEEYKYKLTAALSSFIWHDNSKANGILYQSMENPNFYNVALKPEVIDNRHLELFIVSKQRLVKTPTGYMEADQINTKNIDHNSGLITW